MRHRLLVAVNVATGAIKGQITKYKKGPYFMADLRSGYPQEQEIHLILDNYRLHPKNDEWLQAHPNVTFHDTST